MLKFILTIIAVISYSKEVYISFDFVSLNQKIISGNFFCSKALVNSCNKKKFVFKIKTNFKNEFLICKLKKEELISKLLQFKANIYSNEYLSNKTFYSRIKLSFPPKKFNIIIKDNTAYFYECKE